MKRSIVYLACVACISSGCEKSSPQDQPAPQRPKDEAVYSVKTEKQCVLDVTFSDGDTKYHEQRVSSPWRSLGVQISEGTEFLMQASDHAKACGKITLHMEWNDASYTKEGDDIVTAHGYMGPRTALEFQRLQTEPLRSPAKSHSKRIRLSRFGKQHASDVRLVCERTEL